MCCPCVSLFPIEFVFHYFSLNFRLAQALCPHLVGSLSPKIPSSMTCPWVHISLRFKEQILLPPVGAGPSAARGRGDLGAAGGFFFGHWFDHSSRKGHVMEENNLFTQFGEGPWDKAWQESWSQENVAKSIFARRGCQDETKAGRR